MKLSIIIPVFNNEDFIAKTIKSILEQSFRDFEVIIINDGSKDDSQRIIEEIASDDSRITQIYQENQGVSSARNRGLEMARGEFVYFVDGDDFLPKDSLMHMNQISNVDDCDVIVGIYERVDGVTPYTNGRSRHLSKKTARINKDDVDMLYSWSLCNKWFRKSIIDKCNLRFENYTHFEDAVFLYSYLIHTDRIYSCPHIVYTYRKPLATIGRTTTQDVSTSLLENSNKAFLRIQEITESFGRVFRDEMNRRYISSLIGDYYRRVWCMDRDFQDQVYLMIRDCFDQLDNEQKSLVSERFPDLLPNGKLYSVQDMVAYPTVTVIIDGMSHHFVNNFLLEMYDQMMVSFRVEASEEYKEHVDPFFKKRENFNFYQKGCTADVIRKSESRYFALIDCDVVYDHRALFSMVKKLERNPELDFVSLKLVAYHDNRTQLNEIGKLIFDKGLLEFDYTHANKLYRKEIAEGIICKSGDIYQRLKYAILDKPCVIDYRSEEEIILNAPKNVKQKYKILARQKKINKIKKSIKNNLMSGQKDEENSASKSKKEITQRSKRYSAYYNQEITEDTVLIESLEKCPRGSTLYLLRVLASEKYNKLTVFFVINDSTEEITENILDFNNISDINLIKFDSDEYIRCLFSAKYLFNEVYFPGWWIKKAGQIYVNIWHGTPLKKLGRDKMSRIHHDANAQRNFAMADFLLCPSDYTRDRILTAYGVRELCNADEIELGYPRTGVLFDKDIGKKVKEDCHLIGKQVIAWMPTWNDNLSEEIIKSFLIEIDKKLKEDQVLIVKLHRNTESPAIDYSNFRHIEPFSVTYDTYEMLSATDVLITDYSSVFFDFAVTERKIILHCPDYDRYVQDRGLYLDIHQLPFPVTSTIEDLVTEINKPITYYDSEFLKEYSHRDSIHNAEDLCEIVFSGHTQPEKVRKINTEKNDITFLVSDGFSDMRTNDELYDLLKLGKWDKKTCLSFVVRETDEHIDRIDSLLRQVPIYGTRNYILDERSERMRLFWNMSIKELFLLDTTNPKRIRSFARFPEKAYLFITEDACKKMIDGDQKLVSAVRFFEKHGNGIFSFSEAIALRIKELLGIEVTHFESLHVAIATIGSNSKER